MLVNCNISTNNWDVINIASYNITGVRMHGTFRSLCILNVYNDCGNNGSIEVMERVMKERERAGRLGVVTGEKDKFIWLGDFNRHHPLWDKERNIHLFTKLALEAALLRFRNHVNSIAISEDRKSVV